MDTYNRPIKLLAAIAVFAFVALIAQIAQSADLAQMQKQMFGVTAQLNDNCSATLIYSDRDKTSGEVTTILLTAKHCAESKGDVWADIPVYQNNRVVKKERFIAKVKGTFYKDDLGLIELKDKQTYFATVAKLAPEKPVLMMGEDVWTVGYPLGLALTVTNGLFGSYETSDYPSDGTEYYRATPSIAPGNSGGSLYRLSASGNFEMIGVTSAMARGYPFIGLYVPSDRIHEYLKVAVPGLYPKPEVKAAAVK